MGYGHKDFEYDENGTLWIKEMTLGVRQTQQKLEDRHAEWMQQLYHAKHGECVDDDHKDFEYDENGTIGIKRMTIGARQTQQKLEDMLAEWMQQLYSANHGERMDYDHVADGDHNGTD